MAWQAEEYLSYNQVYNANMVINQKGQSLIEVIIALSVVTIITLGFTNITITALRNAQYAKNQNQATRHVQEALEIVRVIRDVNYYVDVTGSAPTTTDNRWDAETAGFQSNRVYCTQIGGSFPTSTADTDGYFLREFEVINATIISDATCTTREAITTGLNTESFERRIRLMRSGTNEVTVLVTVTWNDSKGVQSVEASTKLTRWN